MSFWDNTVATAKDMLEVAARKTEKTVDVQKMRFGVEKQKNKVMKAFETLGRCYYDSSKGDESSAELLPALCEEVETQLGILKTMKRDLAKRKSQD